MLKDALYAVMVVVPGELTTMAGRRLRLVGPGISKLMFLNCFCSNAVRAQLISSGIIDNSAYVVVAGPANTYAHYITTREEYAIQVGSGRNNFKDSM